MRGLCGEPHGRCHACPTSSSSSRPRRAAHSLPVSASRDGPSTSGRLADQPLLTFEEVQAAAAGRGLTIDRKNLGPFYRITCRQGDKDGQILGVTAGFVAPPFKLIHCDTLQVFTKGWGGEAGQRVRGGALGLGLLLGGATFAYAHSCGCSKAEILAINDDDAWHERLVRYYRYFGFEPVCKVGGNGLADWPHMLVWGGEGTRMDADVVTMLRKWTPAMRRCSRGRQPGNAAGDSSGAGGQGAESGTQHQQQEQQQQQQQHGTSKDAPAAGAAAGTSTDSEGLQGPIIRQERSSSAGHDGRPGSGGSGVDANSSSSSSRSGATQTAPHQGG